MKSIKVKKEEKENKKNIIGNIFTSMLELPREVILNLPLITITGNQEMSIENYKGVIEYTEERIRINTTCGIMRLEGKKLFLKQITSESILVTGNITKFEYLM